MSVVGTHGKFVVGPARPPPMRFFFQQDAHQADHIGTPVEVLGFVKRAIRFSPHLTKVRKMNAGTELASHGQQVVIGARSERTDAKRQSVGERIAGSEDRPHIRGSRDDAGQTEQRPWRIVGMDSQPNPGFLRDWDNLPQERGKISLQMIRGNAVVFGNEAANRLSVLRGFGTRQAGDDGVLQILPACL